LHVDVSILVTETIRAFYSTTSTTVNFHAPTSIQISFTETYQDQALTTFYSFRSSIDYCFCPFSSSPRRPCIYHTHSKRQCFSMV
jgi:hypothetical protein